MPQLVVGVAVFLVNIGVPIAVVNFMYQMVGMMLLNVITSKLFGPKIPSALEGLSAISVMRRSGVEYRKLVYGQASISGPIIYNNVSGDNREYLWYVIALADGEIEELVSVWLDADEIPEADINWLPGVGGADGLGTGNVSTAKWVGDNSATAVQIFYTHGHADQVVMSEIDDEFSDWGTSHRLRGICYLAVKLLYNEDTETVWSGGVPGNIRAVLRGRKVYDPRLDSTRVIDSTTSPITYGTGSHRYATESTWAWTENPALCVADYLTSVMSVDELTSINWEAFASAADDCEVQVAISAASPGGTEDRFTCNGVISMGASHKDNLDSLLSSCDGKLTYVEGMWRLRVSVWEASSVSFDEDDLAGPVEVRGSAPKSERFNTVRGVYVDPNRNYQPAEFAHITNSDYVTRDGGRTIPRDLKLPMTNGRRMAQRIGFRLLEQSDNQIVAKITTNARGVKAAVGDVISLTVSKFSWTAKTFRVIEWQRNPNGTFDMTLREDAAASYTDPEIADYQDGDSGTVTIPADVIPPPTGFSAASVPYGVKLSWTNPAVGEFDFIDVYMSLTSAWSGATRVASVRTDTYTFSVGSGESRFFWVRARRNSGDVSLRAPDSDTSTITGTSGTGTDSVNVVGASLSDSSYTANSVVGYQFTSGGEEESFEGNPASPTVWDTAATWLLSGSAGDYDCRLTVNSGTNPAGASLGTWLDMGTTRTWTLTDSVAGGGAIVNDCTIEIRDGSSFDVLGSANVTMSVNYLVQSVPLSGTTGSPNTATQINDAGWRFNSTGSIQRRRNGNYTSAGSWISGGPPAATYYIQFTVYSGDTPDVGTMTSWQSLGSSRQFYWSDAEDAGTVRVRISSDASGTPLLATGYYAGEVIG